MMTSLATEGNEYRWSTMLDSVSNKEVVQTSEQEYHIKNLQEQK
jgi:hypothetical protein